jgi:DNA-directed RNA polymerase subunit beta'
MSDLNKLYAIQVKLASPEKILEWSKGEVLTAETINYRTQKPEPGGLFCEKIFGPTKDYQCYCGKYKKPKDAGKICEKCGVEITTKAVRRERMGHIKLYSPCTHIWYLKGTPSRIAVLLDIPPKQVEDVVNYASHIVINPGTSKALFKGMVLNERTSREKFIEVIQDLLDTGIAKDTERGKMILERLQNQEIPVDFAWSSKYISTYTGAEFDYGAGAIQKLLKEVDLNAEFEKIQEELKATSAKNQKRVKLLKRLELIDAFIKSHNDPVWMVLTVLPVMPPDLRPMLPLDGGRYAGSDLNDLYRKVINRNNRLKKFIDIKAPEIITINERRMLQTAVDDLIDNGRRSKAVTGPGNRALKSLSSQLKGKPGRFRQNLLGKRVDFSGRSVIAVGPTLEMDQCGIPREMAISLFRPFIIAKLMTDIKGLTRKAADQMIDQQDAKALDAIEQIIKLHPVLLNRAPTLHRLGIQAFRPVLVDGRAIRLHPLVCTGFNADFDGDQMAVHIPLSKKAQQEAIELMIANHNILGPKDGKPICIPTQDMLLGNYYITLENDITGMKQQAAYYRKFNDEIEAEKYDLYAECEGKIFKDPEEVMLAYQNKLIHLQNRIAIRASSLHKTYFNEAMNNSYLITTPGKIIFNSIYPDDFPYINCQEDTTFDHSGNKKPWELDPTLLPAPNKDYLASLDKKIAALKKDMENADAAKKADDEADLRKLTGKKEIELGRYNFVPYGTDIKGYIAKQSLKQPIRKKEITNIINELFYRYKAEKTSHILDKLKNLGFDYSTISGITVALSDISADTSDGSKSPLADKAQLFADAEKDVEKYQKQAEIGELSEEDRYKAVIERWNKVGKAIENRVTTLMTKEVRNPVFIMSSSGARGSTTNFVQLLGMKGLMAKPDGSAIEIPIKSCFRDGLSVSEFFTATHGARKTGTDTALKTADSGYLTRRLIDVSHDVIVREEDCGCDHGIIVRDIYDREPYPDDEKNHQAPKTIISLYDRLVGRFTVHDVADPKTGEVIVAANTMINEEQANKIVNAGIKEVEIRTLFTCETKDGVCAHCYGLNLATGELAKIGDTVGIMAAQSIGERGTQLTLKNFHSGGVAGSEDITQGLPRVQEVLEARTPKNEATMSEIPGVVKEIKTRDSEKKIFEITIVNDKVNISDQKGTFVPESKTYTTNANSTVIVRVNDQIHAGQKLTKEGFIDPKKLLMVTNVAQVESYILQEVDRVYCSQNIQISDKHIEAIARQMLKKILIVEAGDTDLLPGSKVDIVDYTAINQEALINGKRPAVGRPLILGLIKAALDTKSFLSSASFQETTRVLTDAAVKGRIDYLHGLKENVMIGKLIPAGTGFNGDIDDSAEEIAEATAEGPDFNPNALTPEEMAGDFTHKPVLPPAPQAEEGAEEGSEPSLAEGAAPAVSDDSQVEKPEDITASVADDVESK